MIFTDRTITVRKGTSSIDEPIVVYRGDYELEVRFKIVNSKFRFMSGTNLIESEKASYGQMAILTPYGGNIFSEIVRCSDGAVTFVLSADMLNQIEEIGLYSFQIRLFDYNKESRVSIPPIEFGIEVREPIASEDHDNNVNNAIVGYSIAKVVDPKEENVGDTFDESGNYNKTKWETGDRISEGKLNKIEDAIDTIDKNSKGESLNTRKIINSNFNLLNTTKADITYVDEVIAKKELEGGGVDTSVLVFKTDFEPVKKSIENVFVYNNAYEKTDEIHSLTGNITVIEDMTDGVFQYVEFIIDEGNSSACRAYMLNHTADEIDYVTVYLDVELGETCFVGLGTGFNWAKMTYVKVGGTGKYTIKLNEADIPDASINKIQLFVGVRNYNRFKGRFKVETRLKRSNKIYADVADTALISTETNSLSDELYHDVLYRTFEYTQNKAYKLPIGVRISQLDEYVFRDNGGTPGLTELFEDNGWITCKKESSAVGSKYGGVYVRMDYDSIDDLDGMITLNCEKPHGFNVNNVYIMYEVDNWGDSYAVSVNLNTPFNLKNKLLESDGLGRSNYAERNKLYICMVHYQSEGHSIPYELKFKVEFVHNSQIVRANELDGELHKALKYEAFNFVRQHINDIPITGVNILPIDNYNIRDNVDSLIKLTENGEWINCKKESSAVGSKYGGVYIRIDYDSIDDLDYMITPHVRVNGGPNTYSHYILYEMTDWGNKDNYGVVSIAINERFNLKNKLLDSGLDYVNKDHLYICICYYSHNGVSETFDYDYKMELEPLNPQPVRATKLSDDLMNELRSEFKSIDDASDDYITCWGDSLTAGGGWTNRLHTLSGLSVYNGGTGGENSACIMARQGGDVMMINNITIPAQPQAVTIASRSDGIRTQLGVSVTPLLQAGTHVNPCYIGDIKGTLKWTGSGHSDMSGTWTFTRSEAGEEVQITRPTAIRTDFDINRNNPKIMIIFMGQNGGYNNDINELIRQHRLMIEHSNCEDFIVLGLSSGSASVRSEYETAMKKEFGRRFISLREYLSTPVYDSHGNIVSCYGLEDAGLTPTPTTYNGVTYDPLDEIATGTVPHQLLSDSVHYTTACKTVIGDMLYKKLKELNML